MNVIAVKNGILDLDRLRIVESEQNFYTPFQLDVTFNIERDADCPRWKQFLQETIIDAEIINQVQEFIGYCLQPRIWFQKSLLITGVGSSGKSVFLHLIQSLFSPENCSDLSLRQLSRPAHWKTLYGKAVNFSRVEDLKNANLRGFKSILSGDKLVCSNTYETSFVFNPCCKLVMETNDIYSTELSDDIYRRVIPVQFNHQFIEGDQDPFLLQKLIREKDEIFIWALAGLKRLMTNKKFTSIFEVV